MFSQLKAAALAEAQGATKCHVKSYPIPLFSAAGPLEITVHMELKNLGCFSLYKVNKINE